MKICFCSLDPYWHGLADNGGSRTILKSVETLKQMGHDAFVVTKTDRFTWFKHDKPLKKIPRDTDICIAIAISDVKPMYKTAPPGAKLGYWARPFENWQMNEYNIKRRLEKFSLKYNGKIMVNSTWQQEWIKKNFWVNSTVIFNGLDFNEWESYDDVGLYPVVGCLYHKNPLKRWKDCKKLMAMMEGKAEFRVLGRDKFLKGEKLIKFYQDCNIWFVPNEREGCHNVPMEAALCGCLIVVNNNPHNGCMDFCNDETAHIYNTLDEAVEMILHPDYSKVKRMQKLLRNKIGTRERNMEKLVGVFK